MSTANNKNSHYRTNSVKINDQFFKKIQKTYFWPIFPIFGAKKVFPKNQAVMHNFIRVLYMIPRKHPDRCQEGKIGRHYFIGSFQQPPGV